MDRALDNPFAPPRPLDLGTHGRELVLDARNIGVTFKVEGGTVEAVRDVSFQVHRGETIAIVGESGSGKSVTARAVMGLLPSARRSRRTTRIVLDGAGHPEVLASRQMRALRGNRISMIFQEPMSSLNPVYTVGSQIAEVHPPAQPDLPQARRWRARCELLEEVQHPRAGGAAQAVSAPALRRPAPARDDRHGARQPSRRADRRRADDRARRHRAGADPEPHHASCKASYGMAVILITHDLTIVQQFSDYVYVMQHGRGRRSTTDRRALRRPAARLHQAPARLRAEGRRQPARRQTARPCSKADNVRVAFTLKQGGFFKPDYVPLVAVDNLDLDAPAATRPSASSANRARARPPSARRCSGSSQPDGGEIYLRRRSRIDGQSTARRCGRSARACRSSSRTPSPRSIRACRSRQIIEEGLIVNRHRRRRQRPARPRARQALRRRRPARQHPARASRTSSPAASASASPSPAPSRSSPNSSCSTSRPRRSTSRCRRRSSTSCASCSDETRPQLLFISPRPEGRPRALPPRHGHAARQDRRSRARSPRCWTSPQTDYTQRLVRAAFEVAA